MSEDDSSTHPPERRSWLERISSALSGEPTTREDLVELLRDAQADGLIAADTLRMMEGAIAVSDLTVGDVMIPRAQMVALPAEAKFLDLMKMVVESGHSRFPSMATTRTTSSASCWPRTCYAASSPITARAACTSCCVRLY
jgi:magnesium and cobalt transporter